MKAFLIHYAFLSMSPKCLWNQWPPRQQFGFRQTSALQCSNHIASKEKNILLLNNKYLLPQTKVSVAFGHPKRKI